MNEEKIVSFLKDLLDDGTAIDFSGAVETEAENRGLVERVNRGEGFVYHVTEAGEDLVASWDSNQQDLS